MAPLTVALFRAARRRLGLAPGPAKVYAELVALRWKYGRLPTSQGELARRLLAGKREVYGWIKRLEAEGLIVVTRPGHGQPNRIVPVGPWSRHALREWRERGQG